MTCQFFTVLGCMLHVCCFGLVCDRPLLKSKLLLVVFRVLTVGIWYDLGAYILLASGSELTKSSQRHNFSINFDNM